MWGKQRKCLCCYFNTCLRLHFSNLCSLTYKGKRIVTSINKKLKVVVISLIFAINVLKPIILFFFTKLMIKKKKKIFSTFFKKNQL